MIGITLRGWLDAGKMEKDELSEEIYLMTNSPLKPAATVQIVAKKK